MCFRNFSEKYNLSGVVATMGSEGFLSLERQENDGSFTLRGQKGFDVQVVDTTEQAMLSMQHYSRYFKGYELL